MKEQIDFAAEAETKPSPNTETKPPGVIPAARDFLPPRQQGVPEPQSSLTGEEKQEFDRLQATIEKGLGTFVEVGIALASIRDQRLYREQFDTFEDYIRSRWSMERGQAYRLINAATVVKHDLCPIGNNDAPKPANESVVRPLVGLKNPELRRKAWLQAVENAGGKPVTAEAVRRQVDDLQPRSQQEGRTPPDVGKKAKRIMRLMQKALDLAGRKPELKEVRDLLKNVQRCLEKVTAQEGIAKQQKTDGTK